MAEERSSVLCEGCALVGFCESLQNASLIEEEPNTPPASGLPIAEKRFGLEFFQATQDALLIPIHQSVTLVAPTNMQEVQRELNRIRDEARARHCPNVEQI